MTIGRGSRAGRAALSALGLACGFFIDQFRQLVRTLSERFLGFALGVDVFAFQRFLGFA